MSAGFPLVFVNKEGEHMRAKINGVWTEVYLPSALSSGSSEAGVSVYQEKTLAVMGDSISSFAGINGMQLRPTGEEAVYYPRGNVAKAVNMWWQRVCDALGMNRGVINSYSGSRVAASHNSYTGADARAQAGCLDRAKNLGASPDVIVLFLGTNDFYGTVDAVPLGTWNGKAIDGAANCVPRFIEKDGVIDTSNSANLAIIDDLNNDFRLAYAIMLDRVRTKYPYAEVWCCTLPLFEYRYGTIGGLGFPEYNTAGVSLPEWNDAIRDIASMFGCGVINLDKCAYSAWNRADMSVDYSEENDSGLHPNSFGHAAIANEVIRTLDPACAVRYAIK